MEELKTNIDLYLKYDSELETFNKTTKKIRLEKNIVEKHILEILERSNMQNTKLNLKYCSLKYKITETLQPITMEFLKQCLQKYFRSNQDKLINFIKE